ncbi:DUF4232 domain-containing protein [Blastococcus sp. SYSU D00820]
MRSSWLRRLAPVLVVVAVLAVAVTALLVFRPAPGTAGGVDAGGIAPPAVPSAAPPTAEQPPGAEYESPPLPGAITCSPAGLQITSGPVDAALGHRAVVVTVTNCGTGPREVTGYAGVEVLDAAGAPMPVSVVHESTYMVIDPGPAPLVLQPGQTAVTGLSWSATVTDGEIGEGQAVRIRAVAGDTAQVLPMWVDMGTTGEIAVAAWATELAR